MPSYFTYYSALALAIFIFASVNNHCSCSTLTKSEVETEPEPDVAVAVTDGSEIGDGSDDLNLCYGPPLTTGRICESQKALLNFARLSYRVTPLKNSIANSAAIPKSDENRRNGSQSSVNSDNNVCCEGRGTAKGQELWVPLGCGHKVFSRTTYFDGLISFPAIRCTGGSNGVFVKWSY